MKNSKSLIVYVWAHFTCEFGLVSPYLWHSAFTTLLCYVCTFFKCERHLEIDLQACHEWLVNRLVWSWYMHRLMPMYLLTFFSFSKSFTNVNLEKRILRWKSNRTYLYLTKKKGKRFVLKCMVPKPTAKLSKFIQNVYGIDSQKFELFWSKVCKMETNQKAFNQV